MKNDDALNKVVYNKQQDEHVQLLISQNLRLCQTSMTPLINKAQITAEKAHVRVDEMEDRIFIMDNPETGKVTVMWEDRKAIANYIRNALIAMVGTSLLAISIFMVGFYKKEVSEPTKEMIKTMVELTLTEFKAKMGK